MSSDENQLNEKLIDEIVEIYRKMINEKENFEKKMEDLKEKKEHLESDYSSSVMAFKEVWSKLSPKELEEVVKRTGESHMIGNLIFTKETF